jgi:hypothetical protein
VSTRPESVANGTDAPAPVAIAAPSVAPVPPDWRATRPNVVLSAPIATGHVVAGEVSVVGRLGSPADSVVVSIRTRREHLIDSERVVTSPDRLGFEASLTVPGPATGDDTRPVWLEVIAYTNDDVPVAGIVAVLRVHAPPPPRLLGEDGGMGPLGTGDVRSDGVTAASPADWKP